MRNRECTSNHRRASTGTKEVRGEFRADRCGESEVGDGDGNGDDGGVVAEDDGEVVQGAKELLDLGGCARARVSGAEVFVRSCRW